MDARKPALTLLSLALVVSLLIGACGDDDDFPNGGAGGGDATDDFCEAGDRLRAQVSDLASFNVVSEGTDALSGRLDEIRDTVDDLKDAGSDVADAEISAFESSLDEVRADLDELGDGQLTTENASALLNSVLTSVGAAEDVFTKLRETCGE